MNLASAGREYAHFPVSLDTGATLDASFDGGITWVTLERPSTTEARVLVAGPDAVQNPNGTVVLKTGRNPIAVRLVAGQESVIRAAGSIFVTSVNGL